MPFSSQDLIEASTIADAIKVREILSDPENTALLNDIHNNLTALIAATNGGHSEIVSLLIEKGADIELSAIDNTTPLMFATLNSRKEVAEILLNAGANINAINSKGLTALAIAAGYEDVELVATLLQERESKFGKKIIQLLPTRRPR